MAPLWCLYDKKRNVFHNSLSLNEAIVVVRTLDKITHPQWYVWREGWAHWKSLDKVGELITSANVTKKILKTPVLPPEALKTDSEDNEEVSLVADSEFEVVTPLTSAGTQTGAPKALEVVELPLDLDLDLSEEEDRKAERIEGVLSVEIVCRDRTFHTSTRDISLKGLQLVDPVPDWVGGYFSLVLSRPEVDQKLEFIASIVENQELGKKFRLELQPSKDSLHLKRWLLDLHLRNIKKTASQ